MRSIMSVLAISAGVALVVGPAKAQVVATASYERGPRFLLARDSEVVPVDVSKTPVLARRLNLDLAGTTLKDALTEIESQSGLWLSYSDDAVPLGKRVHLRAEAITAAAALTDVLFDAGVDVVFRPDGSAALVKRPAAPPTGSITGNVTNAQSGDPIEGVEVLLQGTRWRTLTGTDGQYRLADVDTGTYVVTARRIGYTRQSRSVTVVEGQDATADFALQAAVTQLEELVTVQKREERLIEVPQSVSVLHADELAQTGALQLRDYVHSVPGLNVLTSGAGEMIVSIRGVTLANDVGPTVGIYVDDVPYGSSSTLTFAPRLAFDAALFDLERVEVLKGPQGTLYGASSMGGIIKYVSKRPEATRLGVTAQAGISATQGGGVNELGALTVNAPIVTGKLAARATGFYSHDGGFIDNVALGEDDANRSNIYGGRADLLFTPTEALSIRLTGFLQNIDRDGEGTADYSLTGAPPHGNLGQNRPTAEPFEQRFRLASGAVVYDMDWAALTSITSYQSARTDFRNDFEVLRPLAEQLFGRSYSGISGTNFGPTDKFVQEVRLASERSRPLEWVIGGFYNRETTRTDQGALLFDLDGNLTSDDLFTQRIPSRFEEYAGFSTLTWYLTDKLNVSGGIRYTHNRERYTQHGSGFLIGSLPTTESSENVVTYLANARHHFSDQATLYLRYATGYRPGGPNAMLLDPTTGLPVGPTSFESDGVKSYEIGFKGETEDRRFGIDLAAFYLDWDNLIHFAVRDGVGFRANAPRGASVPGAELTLTARPTDAFTATGTLAYLDAHMREANADLGAAKGEWLPGVARFASALDADYALPVENLQPTVGATLRYVGARRAAFEGSFFPQHRLPDYAMVDLRAGLTLGAVDAQLYLRNLFDGRGQLSAITFDRFTQVALVQPRTFGLTVTTRF